MGDSILGQGILLYEDDKDVYFYYSRNNNSDTDNNNLVPTTEPPIYVPPIVNNPTIAPISAPTSAPTSAPVNPRFAVIAEAAKAANKALSGYNAALKIKSATGTKSNFTTILESEPSIENNRPIYVNQYKVHPTLKTKKTNHGYKPIQEELPYSEYKTSTQLYPF